MILDKKQIQVIFLFRFKMGHKVEKTRNNNNTFGPGTANEHTVQWWFKKSNQLRIVIEANPLTTTQDVAQEPKN